MELTFSEKDGVVIGKIKGSFDTAAAQQADMKPFLDNAGKTLCFDCSEMDFISSAGLRHLVTLYKESKAKGGGIILKGVNPVQKRIFQVSGLMPLFTFE